MSKTLNLTCLLAWATFETFLQNNGTACFARSSLVVLHSKFLQKTRFKLTLKQTLSKPKPKLIVLIMICQHI